MREIPKLNATSAAFPYMLKSEAYITRDFGKINITV
jgi:hypothetical protein